MSLCKINKYVMFDVSKVNMSLLKGNWYVQFPQYKVKELYDLILEKNKKFLVFWTWQSFHSNSKMNFKKHEHWSIKKRSLIFNKRETCEWTIKWKNSSLKGTFLTFTFLAYKAKSFLLFYENLRRFSIFYCYYFQKFYFTKHILA